MAQNLLAPSGSIVQALFAGGLSFDKEIIHTVLAPEKTSHALTNLVFKSAPLRPVTNEKFGVPRIMRNAVVQQIASSSTVGGLTTLAFADPSFNLIPKDYVIRSNSQNPNGDYAIVDSASPGRLVIKPYGGSVWSGSAFAANQIITTKYPNKPQNGDAKLSLSNKVIPDIMPGAIQDMSWALNISRKELYTANFLGTGQQAIALNQMMFQKSIQDDIENLLLEGIYFADPDDRNGSGGLINYATTYGTVIDDPTGTPNEQTLQNILFKAQATGYVGSNITIFYGNQWSGSVFNNLGKYAVTAGQNTVFGKITGLDFSTYEWNGFKITFVPLTSLNREYTAQGMTNSVTKYSSMASYAFAMDWNPIPATDGYPGEMWPIQPYYFGPQAFEFRVLEGRITQEQLAAGYSAPSVDVETLAGKLQKGDKLNMDSDGITIACFANLGVVCTLPEGIVTSRCFR